MDSIDTANNDRLEDHVVIKTVLASLAPKTRMLDTTKSVTLSVNVLIANVGWRTYGAAESEMTPVLKATMPNCNLSETR